MSEARIERRKSIRLPLGATEERRRSPLAFALATFFVLAALAAAVSPIGALLRTAVAGALLVVAFAVTRVGGRRLVAPRGWVEVDDAGVWRAGRGRVALGAASEPFGVVALASHDRARALLAFTSPTATRFVAVRARDEDELAEAQALFAVASLLSAADLDDALGETDDALRTADAKRLMSTVGERFPGAIGRIHLSSARGEAIVLDGARFAIGARMVDLSAPLEWRAFVFHEAAGRVAAFYQATWIRQADVEAVLVAPLAAEAPRARELRDLRLISSAAEDPPARDLRVAVDRLFMLPLREALDRAPRISRAPSAPSLPRPERRV
jgi:hypothetical protein